LLALGGVIARSASRDEAIPTERTLSGPRLLPRGPSPAGRNDDPRLAVELIGATGASTNERAPATDPLQVQRTVTNDASFDCTG
jgi:hypothetical protein